MKKYFFNFFVIFHQINILLRNPLVMAIKYQILIIFY